MVSIVFVAGYKNSEPKHWQRLWFDSMQNAYWVEQDDWDHPHRVKWTQKIEETLEPIDTPIIFVAHSIGCHTVVEWARTYCKNQKILGALLVAPPDTTRDSFPKEIVGYTNTVHQKLPFRSCAVLSSDDPYAALDKSEALCTLWGSEIVHVGAKGHINLTSNLGEWIEGRTIFESFVQMCVNYG